MLLTSFISGISQTLIYLKTTFEMYFMNALKDFHHFNPAHK